MSIHINIVCDRGAHPGGAIGVRFESLTETFGDVVAGLRELGWHVETDGNSRDARCLCPEHAPRADNRVRIDPGPSKVGGVFAERLGAPKGCLCTWLTNDAGTALAKRGAPVMPCPVHADGT